MTGPQINRPSTSRGKCWLAITSWRNYTDSNLKIKRGLERKSVRREIGRPISRILFFAQTRPKARSREMMIIPLGPPSLTDSSDLPAPPFHLATEIRTGRSFQPKSKAEPIWSCSVWGLPCRLRCRRRGALLPHLFTLAPTNRSGVFSVALSVVPSAPMPSGIPLKKPARRNAHALRGTLPCGVRTFLSGRAWRNRSDHLDLPTEIIREFAISVMR